jgi:DNA-binding NarL/FixJ family response regulator
MEQAQPSPKRMTMLIVEDQAAMRASLRAFVHAAFPRTRIAESANGAHALRACSRLRPQLVLMDVRLPDADGIDLTRQLRAMSPAPAVIIVSYLKGRHYVEQARAAGACLYINKDRLTVELVPAIAWALGAPGAARS